MRIRTVLAVLVVLVVVLVGGLLIVAKSIDVNQYRDVIAQKAEEATGRKLTLAGDIYLNVFTFSPSVTIEDVSFANASWGSRPEMMKLKKLDAVVALLPLLHKEIDIRRFILDTPDILLETDANGKGNWEFSAGGAAVAPPAGGQKAPSGAAPAPASPPAAAPGAALPQVSVNEVEIKDGTLTYRDGKTKQTTTLALDDLSAKSEGGTGPLSVDLSGKYNTNPFTVKGAFGSLAEIQSPKAPFPIDVDIEAGGATIKAIGTIAQPAVAKGMDINVSVDGKSLADLSGFAPGLPKIGPYNFAGHVSDKNADITIDHLKAALGKSDLAGDVTLVKADKPTIRANLTSKFVDLTELQAASGNASPASAAAPGGNSAGGGAPEAKPKANDGRIFSDAPLPLGALKTANADVKLAIAQVVTTGPELHNVNVALSLVNGKLAVKPVQLDVVGGHVDADTTVDASSAQPVVAFNANAKDLDLAELMKEMKSDQKVTGKANFQGTGSGQGGSVRQIMAGLDGHTDLNIGEAHVDNSLLKIVMGDISKAIVGGGDAGKISCVVSRFDIVKGLATSKALVVDTESVTVQGSGTINLATEQLNLHLDPSPKAAAVAALAIPVNISGTLASPSVAPDAAALAGKLGKTAVGIATGGAVGGLASGVLGNVLGGKSSASGSTGAAASSGGNPCTNPGAVATPASAPAKSGQAAPAAGQPAPAQKPANPIEDVGKKLKGLF